MEEDGEMFPSIENHNGRKAIKVIWNNLCPIVLLDISVGYLDITHWKIWLEKMVILVFFLLWTCFTFIILGYQWQNSSHIFSKLHVGVIFDLNFRSFLLGVYLGFKRGSLLCSLEHCMYYGFLLIFVVKCDQKAYICGYLYFLTRSRSLFNVDFINYVREFLLVRVHSPLYEAFFA